MKEDVKKKLIEAFKLKGIDSFEGRKRVYVSANRAVEKMRANSNLTQECIALVHEALAQAITDIEKSYKENVADVVKDQFLDETVIDEQPYVGIPQDVPEYVSKVSGDIPTPDFGGEYSTSFASPKPFVFKKLAPIFCGVLMLLGIAFGWSYFSSFNVKIDKDEVSSNERQQNITDSARIVFKPIYDKELSNFDTLDAKSLAKINFDQIPKILTATGRVDLFGAEFIKIDSEKIYLMNLEVKLENVAKKEEAAFFVGFATYNAAKKLELQEPGSHRYFVVNRHLSGVQNVDKDGWIKLSGIITGRAAKVDAFRETTEFAKPFISLNYGNENAVSEIRNLEVLELR